ncbi:hypothetical protein H0H92_007778 [Tricholoma furcatifolium]|nr:hypothetical protein H0H92_007778 [Tricholoma furcatifolium]
MPQKRERPRGLWKARVMAPRLSDRQPPNPGFESDNDDASSSSSKRNHRSSSSLETLSDVEQIPYWDYSTHSSPYPDRISNWTREMQVSATSRPESFSENPSWTYEDWEDLKDLFSQAADQYENAEPAEALPIMRGVIHECHRFMLAYPDPSVLFTNPPKQRAGTPAEGSSILLSSTKDKKGYVLSKCNLDLRPIRKFPRKSVELPTAMHVILGTVLFMFGNLIAQDPSQAAEGEPDIPVLYWLAALDVFDTGENLPCRTSGLGIEYPEDWQMSVTWGRTLLCIADEMVTRDERDKKEGPSDAPTVAQLMTEDQDWPPESPFATIVNRRPLYAGRMAMTTVTPNELLIFAADHFSRGIFRMPHSNKGQSLLPESFSRAKNIFQIGTEMLNVAEKLPLATERHTWALWADGVYEVMKAEDTDAWREPINRARGRCWVIMGSSLYEAFEAAMEESDEGITDSPEAKKSRNALLKALAFLERAKNSVTAEPLDEEKKAELQELLAETLLHLGNLAPTQEEQEAYYARAQEEGGKDYLMDEDEDDNDGDDLMDDS